MGSRIDLTGRRFGKLVVLSQTDKRMDNGSIVWKCKCDCGNSAEVSARRLIRGKVCSCGCLSSPSYKDYVGKRFGRLLVTEPAGKVRKNGSTVTRWRCLCDCGRETIVSQSELQRGETQSCGCLQKERAKAALNLIDGTSVAVLERVHGKAPQSNNTSGYTGVYQRKNGRWTAYINFKKKRYYLGTYETKEEAAQARKCAGEIHADFLAWYYAAHPQEKQGKI